MGKKTFYQDEIPAEIDRKEVLYERNGSIACLPFTEPVRDGAGFYIGKNELGDLSFLDRGANKKKGAK